jgi:protein YIPF5/7
MLIWQTLTVLNPIRSVDQHIMDDTDLAGPILFCLMFATFLLLVVSCPITADHQGGKSHFGYVYGFILLGTISLHFILNLMSQIGVNFIRTASVLGYCLLPLVLISAVGVILSLESCLVEYFFLTVVAFWDTHWLLLPSLGAHIVQVRFLWLYYS